MYFLLIYLVVSSLRNVPKPGYGLATRSPGPMTGRDSGLGYVVSSINKLCPNKFK